MDSYWLVEQAVNQRIEWAKDWQLKGAKIYAATNIDAAYDVVERFEKTIMDIDSATERLKAREFADSMQLKLGKSIDEIAEIKN